MASSQCTDVVRLSQTAAIELITSTLGAYEGLERAGSKPLETGGQLWGYRQLRDDGLCIHYVEHASVSVFAERKPNSIRDHEDELGVKRQTLALLRPELTLLGDYHSHPHRTRGEVVADTLFEYSSHDERFWLREDQYWTCTNNRPLFLVMTICRLQRVHGGDFRWPRQNVMQFDVGEFRFWLNAVIGGIEGGERTISSNTRSSVVVDPLPLSFFNTPGDRLAHYDPVAA